MGMWEDGSVGGFVSSMIETYLPSFVLLVMVWPVGKF